MSTNKKKPVSITLAAAVVICIITFILGFVISSFAFLDSRLESANEKNAELSQLISEKESEIKELKAVIDTKDENNIVLAEQIQTHLDTIESLNSEVSNLKNDVDIISEAAINSDLGTDAIYLSFASLTPSQQLIILVVLLVILIFIISISCTFIAAKSSNKGEKKEKKEKAKKEKKERKRKEKENAESASENEEAEAESPEGSEEDAPGEEKAETAEEVPEEPTLPIGDKILPAVEKAIDLLYHNNLEDSIADLGGFRFGITNFDEILSDKRRPKSFGNAENGDFVAFMSVTQTAKKLYIIPRALVLSDSTVALRGVTDLFTLTNESGEKLDHGTVKIKSVLSPAVFACGETGWSIESKGEIVALGTKAY